MLRTKPSPDRPHPACVLRMRVFVRRLLLLSWALAGPVYADTLLQSGPQQVPLVELFTSEGCSSCPPADQWLSSLRERPGLWKTFVPVAFHVDYWDKLGWPDRFASPANSQRQYRYRQENRVGGVYTPGFVINGSEWRGWFSGQRQWPESAQPVGRLQVRIKGDNLHADFQPQANAAPNQPLLLNLAWLGMNRETQVARGENRGRTLRHDFVVLQQQRLHSDDPQWQATVPAQLADGQPPKALAAWITTTDSQQPIQALGGWLRD